MAKRQKIAALFFLVICFGIVMTFPGQRQVEASDVIHELENSFVSIAEEVKPSVVHLTSERRPLKEFKGKEDELHRFFGPFDFDIEKFKALATGSGVIMDRQGYILTNNHLVEGSEEIMVKITNSDGDKGKEYEGKVIGRDRATDLAVIKIEPEEPLHPAKLGDSEDLKVGQWAIAIGDPFGLEKTLTVGVISSLGRSGFGGPLKNVRYQNFIQTDASINQGNSGGPLLNIDGEVIGINTFIHAGGQNIGFAIPIKMAREVYDELVEHGEVVRGFLGVQITDLDEGMAAAMKVPDLKGALVSGLVQIPGGSPAEKAGIRHGDVIRKVDEQEIESSKELQSIIGHKRPGDKVHLTLFRKGKEKKLTLELIKFPEQIEEEKTPEKKEDLLGLTVDTIPENLARPDEEGVYITEITVDSPADEAGLSEGDIILEINMQEVANVKKFQKIVSELERGQWVSFYVRRGNDTLYRALKIPSNGK